ncbi:hypothetical protein BpHYR1_018011 [Brachionus plicatilis]|uniref:Uncharacterized protein n=1 Tax=Brachionus plicatilis TaxID=10195 RepID=A0A3M7PF62_BRAPC|nr:hypothetical protein BpHYR1_018011 [Brachionus plicatilis]
MENDWLRADSYFDVDKRQAWFIVKDLKTIFDKCDNVCSDIGLSLHKVVLCGLKNQPNFEVDIKEEIENNLSFDHFLYTKDRFLISDQLYVNIRNSINPEIPSNWKMAANVLGLYAASSNFPCLWCKTHKDNLYLIDGSSKRSFKKQLEVIQKASNTKDKHFRYKTHPIISDIEHSRYLIDLLHLFLRISDVLFELFIGTCTLDNFSTSSTYSLNIFKNEKKSINSIMSNLPAIFEKLNIETLFVNELKNAPQINKIWQSFYQIYTSLKNTPSPGADVIKRSTETWLNDIHFIYYRSDVFPYIHAFTNHLHEFIQKESNVNNFNLEGLEKLNDLTNQGYFKHQIKENLP